MQSQNIRKNTAYSLALTEYSCLYTAYSCETWKFHEQTLHIHYQIHAQKQSIHGKYWKFMTNTENSWTASNYYDWKLNIQVQTLNIQ